MSSEQATLINRNRDLAQVGYGPVNPAFFAEPDGWEMPGQFSRFKSRPERDKYGTLDEWGMDTLKYFAAKSYSLSGNFRSQIARCIHTYMAFREGGKLMPQYAQGQDGVSPFIPRDFFNPVFLPINVLTGEEITRDVEPRAYLTNAEAKSRREDAYYRTLAAKYVGQQTASFMAQQGVEIGDAAPQTGNAMPSLDEFNKSYREIYEIQIERDLKTWMQKSMYKRNRFQLYRLYQITDFVVAMPRACPEKLIVEMEYIDPRLCVFDMDMRDDFGRGMQYFLDVEYMNRTQVREVFPNITDTEFDDIIATQVYDFFGMHPTWRVVDGREYVMVVNGRWICAEKGGGYGGESKYGYEEVYECRLVGGKYVGSMRPLPFQQRSVDDPSKANLGVQILHLGHAISPFIPPTLIRIQSLIRQRNTVMNKLMENVMTMKGTILEINVDLLPDIPGIEDNAAKIKSTMDALLRNKLVFTSRQELSERGSGEANSQLQAIKPIVTGIPPGMELLIETFNLLTAEISQILAVTPSRTGQIGQYATSDTAMINKQQSDYATAYKQVSFYHWESEVLTYVANLLKMVNHEIMKKGGKRADALAMSNGDMVEHPLKDMIYQDIGLWVGRPKSKEDIDALIDSILPLAAQKGILNEIDILHIKTSDDPIEAIRFAERKYREYEQQKVQQEQQMQQMQHQQAMEQMQAKQQGEQAMADKDLEGKLVAQEQHGAIQARNSVETIATQAMFNKNGAQGKK